MYTVDFFIKKFEQIPDPLFVVGTFADGYGGHCAVGWCQIRRFDEVTDESLSLKKIFESLVITFRDGYKVQGIVPSHINHPGYPEKAAVINNGDAAEYQQPTPKQRILAALYDIREMNKQNIDTGGKEQPKTKTVYVSVPVSITEQARELTTN
jgi:hypothetical protein